MSELNESDFRELIEKLNPVTPMRPYSPNRTDLLNHLAEKYNLQRYLEIGVQVPELNFDKIICGYKVGVDPQPQADYIIPKNSDNYFRYTLSMNEISPETAKYFDLIFIDGLHTAEQVKKDFENALKILSRNGFIVLHDCNPLKEEHTIVPRPTERGHWNGDVYRFAVSILHKHTIDIDNGCLVWRNIPSQQDAVVALNLKPIPWNIFNAHRKELLNLITWDEFVKIH